MSPEKDKYKLPEWIGCPPKGTHLDVTKGPKLIQVHFLKIICLIIDLSHASVFGSD